MIKFITSINDLSMTMKFEDEYHPNLRLSLEEKSEILSESYKAWLILDDNLVGETYGFPVIFPLLYKFEIPDLEWESSGSALYCYSTTIVRGFQGKGLGSILKAFWLGLLSDSLLTKVAGHAKVGSSSALNSKFGAKFKKVHPNWCDTNETYVFYEMEL